MTHEAVTSDRVINIERIRGDAPSLRVIVVEPHEIARRGLHEMLGSLPIVASLETLSAIGSLRRLGALEAADILLVSSDVDPESLRELVDVVAPKLRILVMIRRDEPAALAEAARLPAHGFVFEQELDADGLNTALDQLMHGHAPMPAALAEHLLAAARKGDGAEGRSSLTPREREVLGLMSRGLSNKAIARDLGISDHGAKRHVANVLAKLNAPNRTLAVARALQEGLLTNAPR
jgi:DNA-binding NarL/FixJ family response regulator